MTKNKLRKLVSLSSFITAIGFIMIFFSVYFGESVGVNEVTTKIVKDVK
jgi:hypothetical protein